jgi:Uma2 family endonuclease
MAVSAPVRRMMVEEFLQMERPVGDFDYELHDGELVQATRPNRLHVGMQARLVKLLNRELETQGFVSSEVPFRLSRGDLRVADVAFVNWPRWNEPGGETLEGAPELVIEVLSPSNTASEMYAREKLCLENGCLQFWTVDLLNRQFRVGTLNEAPRFYGPDEAIPLAAFGVSVEVIGSIRLAEME